MTEDDRRLRDAYKGAERRAERMRTGRLRRHTRRLRKRNERGRLDDVGRVVLSAYERELVWSDDDAVGRLTLS